MGSGGFRVEVSKMVVVEGGARTCLRCYLLSDLLYSPGLHSLDPHCPLSVGANNKTNTKRKRNIKNHHRIIWWYQMELIEFVFRRFLEVVLRETELWLESYDS